MSEFESNYDGGADRQAITFLFSGSPAPSPSLSLPTPSTLKVLFVRKAKSAEDKRVIFGEVVYGLLQHRL